MSEMLKEALHACAQGMDALHGTSLPPIPDKPILPELKSKCNFIVPSKFECHAREQVIQIHTPKDDPFVFMGLMCMGLGFGFLGVLLGRYV